MKKSSKTLWISVALFLVGCNSFNKYEIRDPVPSMSGNTVWDFVPSPKEKKPEGVVTAVDPACPPFQMPAMPKQPDLPYDKLSTIKADDKDALDDVYLKYIAELRKHDRAVVTIMKKAYSDYMTQCANYVSQKAAEKK